MGSTTTAADPFRQRRSGATAADMSKRAGYRRFERAPFRSRRRDPATLQLRRDVCQQRIARSPTWRRQRTLCRSRSRIPLATASHDLQTLTFVDSSSAQPGLSGLRAGLCRSAGAADRSISVGRQDRHGSTFANNSTHRHRTLLQYHGSGQRRHGFGLHGRRRHAIATGTVATGATTITADHHGTTRSPTAATSSPSSRRSPHRPCRSMPIGPRFVGLRPGRRVPDSGQFGQQPGFGRHGADDRLGGPGSSRQHRPGRSALYLCRADQRPQRRHGDRQYTGAVHLARGHAVQRRQHLHLDAEPAPSRTRRRSSTRRLPTPGQHGHDRSRWTFRSSSAWRPSRFP